MHFLSISDLTASRLSCLYSQADHIRAGRTSRILKGKTVLLFFPESSIRTRVTFEKVVHDLGGQVILFPPSALDKKEELRDMASYLNNWVDLMIIRHGDFSKLKEIARYSRVPVINAMTSENHPCEILSDYYGIGRLRERPSSLRYTFVGEEGNIYNSWRRLSRLEGFPLTHVKEGDDLDRVLPLTDVLLTDPLPDHLKRQDYYDRYRITGERINLLPKDALFNPCPPFYRDEEVSPEAIDSPRFVGYDFKENLIYVQQALIQMFLQTDI